MTRPSAVRSKTKSADQTWLRRSGRTSGWRSALGTLLASTALQLEPGLRVQAIDPFVIDDVAGLPQLQIDHPGPIASMSLRQVNDPIPDDRIAIGPWHVPEGRRAHLPHGQGPALAEAPRDHLPHHLPSNRCGHHFFRSTSRVTSISSCDSAKSFLSRAVFGFKLFQALRVRDAHPAELAPPEVVTGLREPVPAAQVLHPGGLPRSPAGTR